MKQAYSKLYNLRLKKDTLRLGVLMSVVCCISCLLFYLYDLRENKLDTLLWRSIGFLGSATFLVVYVFRQQKTALELYVLALTSYLVMMTGLSVSIITAENPALDQSLTITIGLTTSWVILGFIAHGIRRYMLFVGIAVLLLFDFFVLKYYFNAPTENTATIRLMITVNMSALASFCLMIVLERQYRGRVLAVLRMKEHEQELLQKTRALETANKNLLTFNQGISHDLQGPLRRAISFLELYERRSTREGNEQASKYLDLVKENLLKGDQVTSDLLHYSQLSKDKLVLQEVNVLFEVYKVLKELNLSEEKDGFRLVKNVAAELQADRTLLNHVLTNLLSNAVKFSAGTTQAVIEVGTYKENEYTVLYVKDNGVGFPAEKADKLGNAFVRLHNKEIFKGTGLGLAIVQQIMTLHRGLFRAEGRLNEGASFFCYFPNKSD